MEPARQYADIELVLKWHSDTTQHVEQHYYQGINFWRDYFPGTLGDQLADAPDGEWVQERFEAGELVDAYRSSNIIRVGQNRIQPIGKTGIVVNPHRGRFYPRNILAGTSGILQSHFQPLRVLDMNDEMMQVDLNHPLACYALDVTTRVVGSRYTGKEERGGRCADVVHDLVNSGPGMQVPPEGGTDFYDPSGFERVDEAPDTVFYTQERLIGHIDREASAQLAAYYAGFIGPGMKVLDFMASFQSHLPVVDGLQVTGLGLNKQEMQANPAIDGIVVQDVNANPVLPFDDQHFDVVMCNLSVEYLTDPLRLFAELVRVTRDGGRIVASFSDRWFPPKAIVLWQELHPYERMGLVLDYFLRTEGLERRATHTIQGLLRPEDDRYASQRLYADPLFMVQAAVRHETSPPARAG